MTVTISTSAKSKATIKAEYILISVAVKPVYRFVLSQNAVR